MVETCYQPKFVNLQEYKLCFLPQNFPKSERHSHGAKEQIRDCQVNDEVVPGGPHVPLGEDGVEDDDVADDPEEDDDPVDGEQSVEHLSRAPFL